VNEGIGLRELALSRESETHHEEEIDEDHACDLLGEGEPKDEHVGQDSRIQSPSRLRIRRCRRDGAHRTGSVARGVRTETIAGSRYGRGPEGEEREGDLTPSFGRVRLRVRKEEDAPQVLPASWNTCWISACASSRIRRRWSSPRKLSA